jgi:hypothetical protein
MTVPTPMPPSPMELPSLQKCVRAVCSLDAENDNDLF